MKYLKQENIYTKSKCFTVNSSNKKGNSFIDSINNKENIDYINGISIKSLINSRLNDRSKQKS